MTARRESLSSRVKSAFDFDLWRTELSDASPAQRVAIAASRLGVLVVDGFNRHHLTTRAAALTFTTVFGLVPTLAVAFAMFKAFGGIEDAKQILLPRIVDYLAVGVREQVSARIDEMLSTIHGGAIGAVGSLFMFGAVVSLLSSIEDTFNQIWGVKKLRSYFQRVPVYFTVVMLTPVTVISALSLPAMVRSLAPVAWAIHHSGPLQLLFAKLLPLFLVWIGFAVLYTFMTSARVPLRAALTGGVAGGTLWLVAVWGYAAYAGRSEFYTTVYGPLAAVPVFLFWVYVSWVIVLIGAQIAYATANVASYRDAKIAADVGIAQRSLLALGIMAHTAALFLRSDVSATRTSLQGEIGTSGRLINELVDELIEKGFLHEAGEAGALVPARDPHRVTAADVLHALYGRVDPRGPGGTSLGSLAERFHKADAATDEAWSGTTVADLASELNQEDRAD